MTTIREQHITDRFNEVLDRFSAPRSIQNNPTAMQQDANDMLETVLRHAPGQGYDEWLSNMLRALRDGMTTRSWPAPGELTKACRSGASSGSAPADTHVESAAIMRMGEWFQRYKSQLPGHGRNSRTAEMIRSGVLANEREAKFYGFDLSEDQRAMAGQQPMGPVEWRHHIAIIAKLRGVPEWEAEQQIRAEAKEGPADRSHGVPDMTSPHRGMAAE